MTFNQLKYHLEAYCSIDPLHEDAHLASNFINGHVCIIEHLSQYSTPTLCHYFYELCVPAPAHLRDDLQRYRDLREDAYVEVQAPKVDE